MKIRGPAPDRFNPTFIGQRGLRVGQSPHFRPNAARPLCLVCGLAVYFGSGVRWGVGNYRASNLAIFERNAKTFNKHFGLGFKPELGACY